MNPLVVKFFFMIASAFVVFGCNGGKMEDKKITFQGLSEVPVSKWQQLSSKKIYFGHQSVGGNILDGIKDILAENPDIKLNWIVTTDFKNQETGAFMHSRIGNNSYPDSKIKAFESLLSSESGSRADIAFMKLCYVDIVKGSNPKAIFENYKQSVQRIKEINRNTQIIHLTVPLTRLQTGPKAWVKKILGRSPYGVDDNVKRNEFNQLLVNEFNGRDPIFDLAEIESTKPDGSRMTFKQKGNEYYALTPEYTYDWGHLNQKGRKKAAEQLLLLLVNQF